MVRILLERQAWRWWRIVMAIDDDERIARLAMEVVVRRLIQRVTRNHPRAFDDVEADLAAVEGVAPSDHELIMRRVSRLVRRSC